MKYKIYINADAEEDIFSIYKYVALNDCVENADHLFQKIEEKIYSLATLANHGHFPPELEQIGVHEYCGLHYKQYRIIYTVIEADIYVHCVLNKRRDLEDSLQERLLR